jgi:imidazolonepropionase-like amidohydrolase
MMRMKKYSILVCSFVLFSISLIAQPGKTQTESIIVIGAIAHLGNGVAIENSAIGFKDGVINYVGTVNQANKSGYSKVIDVTGQHLYPGFIAVNSTLGLQEIDAIRASDDKNEVGAFNPNVRSIIAYNAESSLIPTATYNGMLLAQITPRGGVISGSSSVVQMDAWNWEDAIVLEDDGIHLNWPRLTDKSGWYLSAGELKPSERAQNIIDELEIMFKDAKNYCDQSQSSRVNLRLKSMCGLFDGSKSLYIHADKSKEIASSVQFCKKMGVKKIVIVGGYESNLTADLLRENKVPVMLNRVYSLPQLEGDDLDQPFKLPFLLHSKGVKFCFENDGAHDRMLVRNTPFYAGTAVEYGLPYEQAVRALTLDAAEIIGIDKNYGSIELGKSATLFISSGDALDIVGNHLVYAYIDGREINLINRQQELFERYRDKYQK